MYTAAADVNLTFPDVNQDYDNGSLYKDYDASNPRCYNEACILKELAITLYSIIFVFGIIGNGLVIWIAGFRMKKTINAVWFLNLAIADFLCCSSLPMRIAEYTYLFSSFSYRGLICMLNIILFNLNVSASVLLLVAMSIDRCVSVMWPFWAKVHRTRKLVRITVAIIWVLSVLLSGLVFFLYRFLFRDCYEWCILAEDTYDYHQNIELTVRLLRLLIMCVIPLLIILISYVIVFIKLRKCKRSQRSQRPYRIITAVIVCFFICWIPYHIWPLLYNTNTEYILFYTLNTFITILACLNGCINPIIYVVMGQDFKQSSFRFIPARVERALSEHPNDQCREQEDCEQFRTTDV